MQSQSSSHVQNLKSDTKEELRLLSINKVRKILGIRYETVTKLIKECRIRGLIIGNRIKIPYLNLIEFINSSNEELLKNSPYGGIQFLEETQNKIDSIIKSYSGI